MTSVVFVDWQAMILRKDTFDTDNYVEITSQVESELPGDAPVVG